MGLISIYAALWKNKTEIRKTELELHDANTKHQKENRTECTLYVTKTPGLML
jgi:hypothetical protein